MVIQPCSSTHSSSGSDSKIVQCSSHADHKGWERQATTLAPSLGTPSCVDSRQLLLLGLVPLKTAGVSRDEDYRYLR